MNLRTLLTLGRFDAAMMLHEDVPEVSYTTETPIGFPLKQRVQAQIAAVEVLLKALEKRNWSRLA